MPNAAGNDDTLLIKLFDDRSALRDEVSKKKIRDYVRDRQRVRDDVDEVREANVNATLMRQANDELQRMKDCESMEKQRRAHLEDEAAATQQKAKLWATEDQRAVWEAQELERKRIEGQKRIQLELRSKLRDELASDKFNMTEAEREARLHKQCEFDLNYESRLVKKREVEKAKRDHLRSGADTRLDGTLSSIVTQLDVGVERDRCNYEERLAEERRRRIAEEQERSERLYVRNLEKNRAFEREKQRYAEACKRRDQKATADRKEIEKALVSAAHDQEMQIRFAAWKRTYDREQEELKLFRENDQVLRALQDLGSPVDAVDAIADQGDS
eukprot:TRINITY_DN4567_c0_g1_i1.p1 TRINITY_DN4567_c0_g1~~TRINITY_DN4567_c0_g1_i1.p1  ORF type:complete len:367 (+),score=172.61 TRINITY_DN4567_c0_g1_i1:115-1101(+)